MFNSAEILYLCNIYLFIVEKNSAAGFFKKTIWHK